VAALARGCEIETGLALVFTIYRIPLWR